MTFFKILCFFIAINCANAAVIVKKPPLAESGDSKITSSETDEDNEITDEEKETDADETSNDDQRQENSPDDDIPVD